jgi:hypothetical protein
MSYSQIHDLIHAAAEARTAANDAEIEYQRAKIRRDDAALARGAADRALDDAVLAATGRSLSADEAYELALDIEHGPSPR